MKKILISSENFSPTNNGCFEGWGTSLCWWANRMGFSEKLTTKSAELFFSEKGLNLNIMRYNIGGGDDPTHDHIVRTDSEMPGWWKYNKEADEFMFSADNDKKQLHILDTCYRAAGKDAFVEAFSNSPPYYMTVSGCSSGSKNGITDNLKASSVADFAEYLGKVCSYIENQIGIKIKSLAPMNEPFTNYWKAYSPKQEGCFISPGKMQSTVITEVYKAIKKYNLNNTIIAASDETNTLLQYIATKMLSREAFEAVGRINTHTYAKATSHIGMLAQRHNKNIWMDETDWSGVKGKESGEMGPALWLAEKIIEDINTLSPSAWIIWQIVAAYISQHPDEKGRRDMEGMPDLTEGFWGTAFADIDNECIYLTQKYYAFGQFTRYIRPGMTMINTKDSNTLAAVNKENGKIVIVAINCEKEDKEYEFSFDGISPDFENIRLIRTSGSLENGEHWSETWDKISHSDSRLRLCLKGHSISTVIL